MGQLGFLVHIRLKKKTALLVKRAARLNGRTVPKEVNLALLSFYHAKKK